MNKSLARNRRSGRLPAIIFYAACAIASSCTSGTNGGVLPDASDAPCGPSNCPGCCFNNVCQEGTHPSTCGFRGVECQACSPGQICDNGACVDENEGCNLENCAAGCCQGDTCLTGDRNDACGDNGYACEACSTGFHCSEGECVPDACDARTCPEGCCELSTCHIDHSDSYCGWRGAGCQRCTAEEHCLDGGSGFACTNTSSSTYSITLVGAVVDGTKPDAENHQWDGMYETSCVDTLGCGIAGCCPPDIYVEEGSSIAGLPIPKIVIGNTTNPNWNLLIGNVPITQLSGGSITVTLMDEDESILADDTVGRCTGTIREADITAGRIVLLRPGSCTQSVQSITFSFTEL